MEFFSLHSPTSITCLPSSSSRKATMEKSTFIGQALTFPSINKRCPDVRNLRFLGFRTRASGPMKDETGSSRKMAEAIKQEMGTKDNDLVFVAGATGRVGSRTVRELLRLGFRVRAGVRSVRAETLVESVPQMKLDDVTGSSSGIKPVEKLEIVECDLENRGGIGPAIDNASIVVCCIGASEKEVFDITGPYRIDYAATKNLIEAATVAKVDHFILLTSLGTNKIGFPAAILNLFWGVLIWKRKAEEALIASGLPYTIVRPGGMERPTDAYKETHNIVLANEDTYFGGQVSNLQVAELMACMAKNRKLSFCKVVEVIAETTAPLIPMEELLAKIPSQRIDSSSLEELQAEPKPDPAPLSIESKPSTVVEKESIQMEPPKTRPLSPYTVYDDLKPPTSPSPTPSTTPGSPKEKHVDIVQDEIEPQPKNAQNSSSRTAEDVTEKEPAHAPVQKTRPLSPYMAYEDLKPPTSPIPTPSSASIGLKERLVNATPALASNTGYDTAGSTQTASHQSPYHVDSAAAVSQSPIADESGDGQHFKQPKPRPLSPFTMYEDMKPPTSPLPSLPK